MSGGSATPPTSPFFAAHTAAPGAPPLQFAPPSLQQTPTSLAIFRGQIFAPPRRDTATMIAHALALIPTAKPRKPKRATPGAVVAGGASPRSPWGSTANCRRPSNTSHLSALPRHPDHLHRRRSSWSCQPRTPRQTCSMKCLKGINFFFLDFQFLDAYVVVVDDVMQYF
jgi:hypothetical protein